jgi:dephospho-CoA kinase
MNLAVTGSFGSGKSTVGRLLAQAMGALYVDTDQLCRQLMLPGGAGYQGLVSLYGARFLVEDGSVDRRALRDAAFSVAEVRRALEEILHPLVQRMVADGAWSCRQAGRHQVVEVPLLFEVGWQGQFDRTVVVSGQEKQLLNRVGGRDGISAEEFRRVVATQWSAAEKERLGDFVINNSGLFVATVQQVAWLARKLDKDNKFQGREAAAG